MLAVGASSSGPTRWPLTADDGDIIEAYGLDQSDIDTVSFFSSYGPTRDFRVKPEVVAPGDQVCTSFLLEAAANRAPYCREDSVC